MVNQQFFLPMVPDSAPIVINVDQNDYDANNYPGRLIFNLVNEGEPYDMTEATAIFQGTKPDGNAFAYTANVISASVVRVPLKLQMTNVTGRVVCNLKVSNTDGVVGSFNVWLEVQESALSGGDASQTQLPTLVAQAELSAQRAEQAADNAEAWSEHPPYIGANGNWFVWDVNTNLYIDSGFYAQGRSGNRWYTGTAVAGKSTTPASYNTGISYAYENDLYLNTSEAAVYRCSVPGDQTTAKWVYQFTLTASASTLNSLNDVGISGLQPGDLLEYDAVSGKWVNAQPDKAYVRFAGTMQFADLVTNASTLLTAANEDVFYNISDGGTIGSGEAALYWGPSFHDGDVIPADSHIAIINVNRGTSNPASYKYDDFGGFVDISGKADRTEIIHFASGSALQGATSCTISNANLHLGTTVICFVLSSNGAPHTDVNITAEGVATITCPALASDTTFEIGYYNP